LKMSNITFCGKQNTLAAHHRPTRKLELNKSDAKNMFHAFTMP